MATGIVLVYLKEPMAYTQINEYRIYGECFSYGRFGSTDLPLSIYKENLDILKDAEYTKEWLEKKFGTEFPETCFTISNLLKLDNTTLIEIARCMGIHYIKGREDLSREIRKSLKRSIVTALN